MNVFDAIKGTILNVPKDISSGIKSLTSRESLSDGGDSEKDYVLDQGINFDAGGELLSKFQGNWSNLHQRCEENSKQAKVVDGQVTELFMYLERQNDAVNQFLLEISTLPQLLSDLQTATNKIEDLEGQFEVIESELLFLEDVCEEQELLRNRAHHQYQLEVYRQRRSAELEQSKVQLARAHAGKVQRYEQHLQRSLREKQQMFEATFKEEIQHYKKYGKTSPLFKPRSRDETQAENLADFVPESDPSALDDFLKPETETNAPTEPDVALADSEQDSIDTSTDPVATAQGPTTANTESQAERVPQADITKDGTWTEPDTGHSLAEASPNPELSAENTETECNVETISSDKIETKSKCEKNAQNPTNP